MSEFSAVLFSVAHSYIIELSIAFEAIVNFHFNSISISIRINAQKHDTSNSKNSTWSYYCHFEIEIAIWFGFFFLVPSTIWTRFWPTSSGRIELKIRIYMFQIEWKILEGVASSGVPEGRSPPPKIGFSRTFFPYR